MKFSIIIPVYNRPGEVKELLESLSLQTYQNFEVVVVEDGSSLKCEDIVASFQSKFPISYYYKINEGRSIARNYGIARATGDYFIIFDSDCIIPEHYLSTVEDFLQQNPVDCFGGPDAAHPSFTPVQKAISYSMTSFFTTGGLRGGSKKVTKFYPRSFNMGFNKKVMDATGGFPNIPLAEDIELSFRIEKAGLKIALIEQAFVYHKRRTSFRQFFRQVNRFGIGRIDLYKKYPSTLKLTHFIPALFVCFTIVSLLLSLFCPLSLLPLLAYLLLIVVDSAIQNKNISIGFLSAWSALIQMFGYGTGFIKAFVKRVILKQGEFGRY
ncbi:MAG TPA: glycosyltransferase [Cytophagaceae bacterium]|nr:glycosyltransferase [Cytophagaceae bacterium]